jgi:hypothetical protein
MRFVAIGLLALLVNGAASQEKDKKEPEIKKGDPVKLEAIKVDCSYCEKTWGVKTKDASIWKTEERKGDKTVWTYEMKFYLSFESSGAGGAE